MAKKKILATISGMIEVTDSIYSMWLDVGDMAKEAKPGQFVSLYVPGGDLLLPRPISICEINGANGILRLVFRVAGKGTEIFSKMNIDDNIEVMGPLGNGFSMTGSSAILIGGGIGIPPMLQLAKDYPGRVTVVLGYRDSDLFLKEEFEKYGTVYVSTEDGSVGTKGNVIDAIRANNLKADVIYACGPTPMLRGVKNFGEEANIPAYISMEERMACGIGACLACVCKSKEIDDHSKVHNKRVCMDGPVFLASDIDL